MTLAARRLFGAAYDPPEHVWLAVQFSPSEAGQAAGREFLKRKHLRREGRDPEVNDKVSPAQIKAMDKWGVQREGSYDYLKTIKQPTLVVNGSNEVITPTGNSFIMQQNIPNAQLIIYPDSNHGAQHQYLELFVEHATLFLNAVTTTTRPLGNSDPKGINMAVQSENERNKAVVDEYFKAGVQGHLTSFAANLHPNFTVTAPNYLPWGGRHVGAAFFRDHVLPSVTDVFDFARFSYDSVVAEDDHVVAAFTARQPGDDCFGYDT
jgi:ketosteroid isomerase-like protein